MKRPDHKPTVYIVDDDEAVAHALKFALEFEGFQTKTFLSGEELLKVDTFADSGCLVLDYRLTGADGLETLDALRSRGVQLPSILITSYPSRALSKRAKKAGAIMVYKPLMSDELVTTLRELVSP